MTSNDPIIVIGGGIAGICCIQTLADELPSKDILLITSSNLVKVTTSIERFGLNLVRFSVENQHLDQFKTNYPNVRVVIDKVIELDSLSKKIRLLKADQFLKYDQLAICTGASPKQLDIKCNLSKTELDRYCCVIRDTETVKDLEKKFSKSKRVCILGNGGIATELVFSIKCCKLIWIIRDQHITSTFLDAGASHFLRSFVSKDELNKKEINKNNELTLDDKVIKRLKYTIIEGESKIDVNECQYGSALGPDWQQKFELKGVYNENTKEITFEKNCELINLLKFSELSEESRLELDGSDGLYRGENKNESWPIFVQLSNGKLIGCDLLINAIGVKANLSLNVDKDKNLHSNLQLASDGGILIDKFMRTSLTDVYAAGDVCTPFANRKQVNSWLTKEIELKFNSNQIQTQHWHQLRLWTQARQMGIYVANSIAFNKKNGNDKTNLDELNLHSCFDLFTHMTSFFGFKVILIGLFNGQQLDSYKMLVSVQENKQYSKVIIKDGKLKGCILIGDTDLEETFENLILNQLDISDIKDNLLDNTVDLEDYFD